MAEGGFRELDSAAGSGGRPTGRELLLEIGETFVAQPSGARPHRPMGREAAVSLPLGRSVPSRWCVGSDGQVGGGGSDAERCHDALSGVGALLVAQAVVARESAAAYAATNPASATLDVDGGVKPALLSAVWARPGIIDATTRQSITTRVLVDGQWRRMLLSDHQ